MAGNKHKNGIVCMFPGCEKKMRTQKFKGHFVKAHLREGEEYTVDHRRQYEVAQTEPLADSDSPSTTASPMELMGAGTPKVKAEAVKMVAGIPTGDFTTDTPRLVEPEDTTGEPTAAALTLPPPTTALMPQPAPTANPAPVAAPAPVRAKRPAAAMANDTTLGLDDSTMMKMLVLMDSRFNELSAKMDEMVEMQRLLFSTIMAKEQEEQAAKKRKESTASNTTIV